MRKKLKMRKRSNNFFGGPKVDMNLRANLKKHKWWLVGILFALGCVIWLVVSLVGLVDGGDYCPGCAWWKTKKKCKDGPGTCVIR